MSPAAAERILCDAEVQDTSRRPARVSKTIPPSVKNEVIARSGDCCEIPGCTRRGHLEFHHLRGRGRGHDADTTLRICGSHHDAPHEGSLRIEGASVSAGLVVRLADGTVLGTIGGASRDDPEARAPGESPSPASRDDGGETVGLSARHPRWVWTTDSEDT